MDDQAHPTLTSSQPLLSSLHHIQSHSSIIRRLWTTERRQTHRGATLNPAEPRTTRFVEYDHHGTSANHGHVSSRQRFGESAFHLDHLQLSFCQLYSGTSRANCSQEVHSALPLDPLGNGTPELLAADVEYRLHLIAQEARKFMVAAKRRTLRPEDVEMAMEAMNVEVSGSLRPSGSCIRRVLPVSTRSAVPCNHETGLCGTQLTFQPVLVPPAPLSSFSTRSPFVPLPTGPSSNPLNPTAPSALSSSSHPIYYHTPDEEIDFSTFLRQPLPPATRGPGGVRWKAHWLAVEGVQPAIPENPAPSSVAKEGDKGRPTATEVNGAAAMSTGSGAGGKSSHPTTGQASLRASARQTLPQELQLYFSNLTSSLAPDVSSFGAASGSGSSAGTASVGGASAAAAIPEDLERHRQAALASLRSDPALAGVLVYLVRWLNESITKSLAGELQVLGWLLDGVGAVLDNGEVFLEPYVSTLPRL